MNMMIHARDNMLSCFCMILRLEEIQQSYNSQKNKLFTELGNEITWDLKASVIAK